ncbi:MAG: BamA/TamA family outer membrane protein [Bacteroidota bacterium]
MKGYLILIKYPWKNALLLVLAVFLLQGKASGQPGGGESKRIEGKTKFIPIPYINYDRSLGFSLGAVPLLMFNPVEKDSISPSSLMGGVATYSTSKTWFVLGFGMFYLNEDRWRITSAGGIGAIHFQFYLDNLISIWVPYQSEANFALLRVERKIYEELYGGISYVFADVVTSMENLPIIDTMRLHGIGLNLSLDKRSNLYCPRSGYYTTLKFNSFPEWLGNEKTSQKIEMDYNHYFPVRAKRDVLATRIYLGAGLGELSFNQQFIVKAPNIRGYTQGAYRGNQTVAAQGEYRWNFHRRWGAVGFAGIATVFNAINETDNGKILPGIGTGIRFRAFEETKMSVGIDVAAGIDDWGIYFQIGEAF